MAEPDILLRAATKSDGKSYYEHVFMFFDDILASTVTHGPPIGWYSKWQHTVKTSTTPPAEYIVVYCCQGMFRGYYYQAPTVQVAMMLRRSLARW